MSIFGWIKFLWALWKLYPTIKGLWLDAKGVAASPVTTKDFISIAKTAIETGKVQLKTADGKEIITGMRSDGSVQ